jgi:hypothetical protein
MGKGPLTERLVIDDQDIFRLAKLMIDIGMARMRGSGLDAPAVCSSACSPEDCVERE